MADSKIFRLRDGVTIEGIGREVENFLRNEKDLTVEGFASSDGYLVQAKESSSWKKFTGLGQALQVQIIPSGAAEVLVNIGQGKWDDKVGAGAVGLLVFAPLASTSAFGAYKQNKLPAEIFACIEKFIMSGGTSVRRSQFKGHEVLRGLRHEIDKRLPELRQGGCSRHKILSELRREHERQETLHGLRHSAQSQSKILQ